MAVRRLVLAMPHGASRRLGRALGALFYAVSPGRRRLTQNNLRATLPELDARDRRRVARECFRQSGATFLEALSAERFDADEVARRFEVVGWEHLEQAEAAGRGVFLMTGHFGNWELGIYPLGARLGPLHVLARPQSNPFISRAVEATRSRWGHVLVPAKGAALGMLNVVRGGGRMALLIDQRVWPVHGFLLPFLGQKAWTTRILGHLSVLTGAPVVPAFCIPLEGGRYRLTIHPPVWPEGRGLDAEVDQTVRSQAAVEEVIRERPELWFWMHRRWQRNLNFSRPSADWIENNRRKSGLPRDKTFASLDVTALPAGTATELERLVDSSRLEAAANAIIIGAKGTGKTHAACAVADALIDLGHPLRFATAASLVRQLVETGRRGRMTELLTELDQLELLVVDAVEEMPRDTEASSALLALLRHRAGGRSTLFTSRLAPSDWKELLADAGQAAEAAELLADATRVDLSAGRRGSDGATSSREISASALSSR